MLFSSIEFIFIFLPVFFLIYWILPGRYSNLVLFLGSLIFYAYGEHLYFVLILISLLIHYTLTRLSCGRGGKVRKICTVIMLIYGFGTLFIFKYMGFFQDSWNHLAIWLAGRTGSINLPQLDLPRLSLPLGISFYTFQISAYAVDVYRGEVRPEKRFSDLGAFLCMFPQLIAGPIVIYSDIAPQLRKRRLWWSHVENGLKIFIIGLSLKVLLANTFGILWNQVRTWGVSSVSVPMVWLAVLSYTFQIYFDFQGYSLMAMGLGEMLGFRIPRNFRHPYTALTVTDFWRRWHITLSRWFRNYVYIPLGGSRKGALRTVFNMLLVWAFTGLWHGASWNFVLWGLYYFVLLVFEKLVLYPIIRRFSPENGGKQGDDDNQAAEKAGGLSPAAALTFKSLGWLYTFLAVMTGWVIFALDDVESIRAFMVRMFCYLDKKEAWMLSIDMLHLTMKQYWLYFLAGAICCTPAPFRIFSSNRKHPAAIAFVLLLFAVCVYKLCTSQNNPFLYFRF